ncbi:MAG: hypothetical protein LBH68_00460 [Bifidobacteriaceae bacterium]|jgi:hypothetical protein|nr:hypothetical protein [Bifidobacteriaceae bacterium]
MDSASHRPSLGLGDLLMGRYRLDSELFCNTPNARRFASSDKILDRKAEVYLIDGPHAADAIDAARRAALIDDPRLVRVFDAGSYSGVSFVLTAPLEGVSLADVGPLSASQARAVAGEVASGLAEAAARDVYHLALRPEVVFLGNGSSVTLGGLGWDAALRGDSLVDAATANARDAQALVAILYAALTARWPGKTPSVMGLPPLWDGEPVAPIDLVSNVPGELNTLCAVTLRDTGAGPKSAAELIQILDTWKPVNITLRYSVSVRDVLPQVPDAGGDVADAAASAPVEAAEPAGAADATDSTEVIAAITDDQPADAAEPAATAGAADSAAEAGGGVSQTAPSASDPVYAADSGWLPAGAEPLRPSEADVAALAAESEIQDRLAQIEAILEPLPTAEPIDEGTPSRFELPPLPEVPDLDLPPLPPELTALLDQDPGQPVDGAYSYLAGPVQEELPLDEPTAVPDAAAAEPAAAVADKAADASDRDPTHPPTLSSIQSEVDKAIASLGASAAAHRAQMREPFPDDPPSAESAAEAAAAAEAKPSPAPQLPSDQPIDLIQTARPMAVRLSAGEAEWEPVDEDETEDDSDFVDEPDEYSEEPAASSAPGTTLAELALLADSSDGVELPPAGLDADESALNVDAPAQAPREEDSFVHGPLPDADALEAALAAATGDGPVEAETYLVESDSETSQPALPNIDGVTFTVETTPADGGQATVLRPFPRTIPPPDSGPLARPVPRGLDTPPPEGGKLSDATEDLGRIRPFLDASTEETAATTLGTLTAAATPVAQPEEPSATFDTATPAFESVIEPTQTTTKPAPKVRLVPTVVFIVVVIACLVLAAVIMKQAGLLGLDLTLNPSLVEVGAFGT